MRPLKALAATALAALALGTLAACGNSDVDNGHDSMSGMMGDNNSHMETGPNQTAAFNDADVEFAQAMIPHHQQALDMVKLTKGRTLSSETQAIVDGIQAAQAPEIQTMTGWLEDWGKSVPSSDSTGHDMGSMDDDSGDMGMGHGGSMPGMMTQAQMNGLRNATDAMFENMWLRMMVAHHEGAVEMAKTELKNGKFPDALRLAQAVITGQTAEIARMSALLAR